MAYTCYKWALRFRFVGVILPATFLGRFTKPFCMIFEFSLYNESLFGHNFGGVGCFVWQRNDENLYSLTWHQGAPEWFSLRSFGGICQHNCGGRQAKREEK